MIRGICSLLQCYALRLFPIVDVQCSFVVYAGLSNPSEIVFEIFQSV